MSNKHLNTLEDTIPAGEIICGDCGLHLRAGFYGGSVDLIIADPPFNTGRKFGKGDLSFDDKFGRVDKYIAWMESRLFAMNLILKPSGSLYLHCDPHASHYLKVLLDKIFGAHNFRNEIIWRRHNSHNNPKRWGSVHDVILYYSKMPNKVVWNPQYLRYKTGPDVRGQDKRGYYTLAPLLAQGITGGESSAEWLGYDPKTRGKHWAVPRRALELAGYSPEKSKGLSSLLKLDLINNADLVVFSKGKGFPSVKVYVDDLKGVPVPDVIDDIPGLQGGGDEKYPTQKPVALYERIIAASSNKGGLVVDPFCGSGTTLVAAHRLGRKWIGIDSSKAAVEYARARLEKEKQQGRLDV